ncbi:MAG: MBL fold metallo-hydrolase [Phycisphaerales bacterium]|nr:MBL fold metallo-hydrolase [Phycisphaerales bacterium]
MLQAGSLRLDGGGMFGVVPKAVWSRLTEPDEQNRIPLQANCLLLQSQDRTVLVETGCGDKWSDKARARFSIERRTVVDALAERGVDPGDVTDVVLTHLHFDHAGGLTRLQDDRAVPVFGSARVHVQGREWEDALANRSTMTGTYLRNHLDPIADRVRLLDEGVAILPGIESIPMPGHTWGQQAVLVRTQAGTVCFPGDVMPTRHHLGAAYSMGYDMLPYQNMCSKRTLLERAEEERWTLVLDHEPGHASFTVRKDGDWFQLDECR